MFSGKTVLDLVEGIKAKEFTSVQVVEHYISMCESNKDKNAVIEVFADCIDRAKEIDKKIAEGKEVGKLAGIPIAFNDNILIEGKKATCCSPFLVDFVAPYSATVVNKLLEEDCIPFARLNMDEFALGNSTESSVYGATKNAIDDSRVAGGASGGAAVAVSMGMCPVAIATDINACSFNDVVGMKTTKGTISRYGTVVSASDQVTPITSDIESLEYVLKIMAGKDFRDGISIDNKFAPCKKESYKVGLIKEAMDLIKSLPDYANFEKAVDSLKASGAEIIEVSVPHFKNALATYYIMGSAETTSSLARYDGVKSSRRSDKATDLESIYVLSRSEGFGLEAKRRIFLGNFVLSKSNYNLYFKKARKASVVIANEVNSLFESCDIVLLPATLGEAFKLGEKVNEPVEMYKEDTFTVLSKIAGTPIISVPNGLGKNSLPVSVLFMAGSEKEEMLFDIATKFESRRNK